MKPEHFELLQKEEKRKFNVISTLTFIAFILAIILIWSMSDNSDISLSCHISGIEYTNITPSECWHSGFTSDYCPLPNDVDCSGNAKSFSAILGRLIIASI